MPSIPTVLRTLWYLRPEQWKGQLRHRLRGGVKPLRFDGKAPSLRFSALGTHVLGAPGHVHCDGLAELTMLNHPVVFGPEIDWEMASAGPLWRYQLHQFDWARSVRLSAEDRERVILDWISRHPVGTGWDAGPISLRLFTWLKLLLTESALPANEESRRRMLASIADQLVTLEAHLETHLLANHYLWNLLALVFAGTCLEGRLADSVFAYGERLVAELDEQFGDDGVHYERSPMYHALLLETLLDLINALAAAPGRGDSLGATLREKAARSLGALETLTHPDGDIALFGDSAHGLAPRPSQLHAYGQALGIRSSHPDESGVLRPSGFVRLEAGPFVLLVSAGMPSPPYQPGHAHCDALSFELSVRGQRVVTDTGVFEYQPGPHRDHARSTAAHATVQINGNEQAETWAAHRIGGRPDVALTRFEPGSAIGVCAGFADPEVLHKRSFCVDSEAVTLEDSFDIEAATAEFRLPLAPGLDPILEGRRARVPLAEGTLQIELPAGLDWKIEMAAAYPEFGKAVERPVLVGRGTRVTAGSWTLSLA